MTAGKERAVGTDCFESRYLGLLVLAGLAVSLCWGCTEDSRGRDRKPGVGARLIGLEQRVDELERQLAAIDALAGVETGAAGRESGQDVVAQSTGDDESPSAIETTGWTITPDPELKGRLGRVVVEFPKGVARGTWVYVYNSGQSKPFDDFFGGMRLSRLPGQLDLIITGTKLAGVEVRAGSETRVHVGALRVHAGSGNWWQVYRPGAKDYLERHQGDGSVGLLAGTYEIGIGGGRETVIIKPGEITEF